MCYTLTLKVYKQHIRIYIEETKIIASLRHVICGFCLFETMSLSLRVNLYIRIEDGFIFLSNIDY